MRNKIIPYEPHLKELARQLRNKSTCAEVLLWKQLSGKKMYGYDFHRQKPLLKYIVDFFSPQLMLVIEIDGITHLDEEALNRDNKRQKELEAIGIRFLRFSDQMVRYDMPNVLRAIEFWIEENGGEIQHTPDKKP
jgi:very-short-patch-repair endonuclease